MWLDDHVIGWSCYWMIMWLDDHVIGWSCVGWSCDWMIMWLDDHVIGWSCYWMIMSLDDHVIGWSCHWMIMWLDGHVIGWSCDWMIMTYSRIWESLVTGKYGRYVYVLSPVWSRYTNSIWGIPDGSSHALLGDGVIFHFKDLLLKLWTIISIIYN